MNAIDTNILVYAIDAAETTKGPTAMALLDRLSADDTVLLWQVACEFGAAVAKVRIRGGTALDPWDAVALMRARFPLVLPDEDVLDVARSCNATGESHTGMRSCSAPASARE